jgi:RNA polymerase-associated protein RTF1
MDISDSESEDGQISKRELEDERLLSLGGYKSGKEEVVDSPSTMVDLETCRLTRDLIVKHCVKPWFEDYVKGGCYFESSFGLVKKLDLGAWVRYLIGHETEGGAVYRICQVSSKKFL